MERFFSKITYAVCLALAIFWAVTIPYTRFVMGVHSLDQIMFGSSLGVWSGLTMHFLVRDNLLKHVEKLINSSQEYTNINSSKEQERDMEINGSVSNPENSVKNLLNV